jgi:uncharacterized protein (UPF0264 family)
MTGMLASVTSVDEALMALQASVDIIDLKQPSAGALGALDIDLVKRIVREIDGRCPVSATIGDLPMQPELVLNAVEAMAETGVDYIKIGFFPGGEHLATVEKLTALTQQNLKLIAVLFADGEINFAFIDALKNAGFKGVMLDTMNKKNGSLNQVMGDAEVARFVRNAKNRKLICGLAGSLRLQDIPSLMTYKPDYLGFRGALCLHHNRISKLSRHAIANIRQAINAENLAFSA